MEKIARYRKNLDFPISLFYSIYTNKYSEFNLNSMDKQPKKLLEQVRDRPRLKHFSIGTEDSYLPWIRSLTLTYKD